MIWTRRRCRKALMNAARNVLKVWWVVIFQTVSASPKFVIWPVKIVPDMTHDVFGGTIKPCSINQSINQSIKLVNSSSDARIVARSGKAGNYVTGHSRRASGPGAAAASSLIVLWLMQYWSKELRVVELLLISPYSQSRLLRSSTQKLLSVLPHNLDTAARRFSVAAPRLWNSLPLNCRTAPSVNTFKIRLKTFLFDSA